MRETAMGHETIINRVMTRENYGEFYSKVSWRERQINKTTLEELDDLERELLSTVTKLTLTTLHEGVLECVGGKPYKY